MSSLGSSRSIRNGEDWNQSLGVVFVASTLEKTSSSWYLMSTEEMIWEVCGGGEVVVRWLEGDGKESEKKERWPEGKLEIACLTNGSSVEGQSEEQISDHSFSSEQRDCRSKDVQPALARD